MQIYVCVKHVPDSAARVTVVDDLWIDENITFLLNPYDENAVEAAVRIAEKQPDTQVVAITVGRAAAVGTLKSALAMGADRAILVQSDQPADSLQTARVLAAAILADGAPDLIFAGRMAIDSEGYQTHFRLAAALDLPVATNVTTLDMQNGVLTAECEFEAGGRMICEMPLPCVVGAGKGLNEPRYPTFRQIVKARKKEIRQINAAQLQLEVPAARVELTKLRPVVENRRGEILAGTPEVAVARLIRRLRERDRVI